MSASLPLPPWYSPGPALPQKSPLANEAIYGLVLKAVEARPYGTTCGS